MIIDVFVQSNIIKKAITKEEFSFATAFLLSEKYFKIENYSS